MSGNIYFKCGALETAIIVIYLNYIEYNLTDYFLGFIQL